LGANASANAAMVFENSPKPEPAAAGEVAQSPAQRALMQGEIPADFWERPRTLRLARPKTKDRIEVVYYKDGKIVEDGYWQACALLRDDRANRMTSMDPMLLDI